MTTQKSASRTVLVGDNPYHDNERLQALQLMLCLRTEELMAELEVRLYRSRKMYSGCCPIHSGDNPSALNLYIQGESVPGFWRCNTKHCERVFKKTIVGFVRGVLSQQEGWSLRDPTKNLVPFQQAVDWCCNFLGQKLADIKVDWAEVEKRQFAAGMLVIGKRPEQKKGSMTQKQLRSRLQIPSQYFVNRGWSSAILDRYDVGLCSEPSKPFFNRVVVPVYDNDHKTVVGTTARSIYPCCKGCHLYHCWDVPCPKSNEEKRLCSKWRNSDNFRRDTYLYNYWFARKSIRETGVAILVEGPPNIWRLEEAGFEMGLGMFGADLTDQQQVLLEISGAMNVIVLTDNDETGKQAADSLRQKLGRAFRLHFPKLETNDVGEMKPEAVQAMLSPLLIQIRERGY